MPRTTTDWLVTWQCGHNTQAVQDSPPARCGTCGCTVAVDTASYPVRLA